MKVISVWTPWSSLIISGHKKVETRSWPAPRSLIGTRIAIAATKTLKPEQRAAYIEPSFQQFYGLTSLPDLDSLPRGAIIGTIILTSCEEMTDQMIQTTDPAEKAFGDWRPGRFAWRMTEPQPFDLPVAVRGAQGIWVWTRDREVRAA